MQKKSFSWGIIVLMFFLFFPIGIWMLVKKMTEEKFNYIKNGKSLKNLGWILISIAMMYLIMCTTDEVEIEIMVYGIVIFGVCGALLLYKSDLYIKKGTKYKRYVSIINFSNDTLIDNIAAAYPTTYEKAVEDIRAMIYDGYFMNAYIDLNSRELIIPRPNTTDNNMMNQNTAPVEGQLQSVKCRNCGATNILIHGAVNECEYCGSLLQNKGGRI